MSGGQKQRLALAAATLHSPELLLLDEPTSAVDPQSRRDFWERLFQLAEAGATILVSTHYMDEAERCHGLAIIAEGRVVAEGTPRDLMAGVEANVYEIEGADGSEAPRLMRELPWVHGVTQLGIRLRVLADRSVNGRRGPAARAAAAARHRGAGRAHRTPASKTCSWWRRGPKSVAANKFTRSVAAPAGRGHQGSAPAFPRPRDLRHDRRRAAHADHAVRLCHQLRRAQSRHRGAGRRELVDVARVHRAAQGHAGGARALHHEFLRRARRGSCARAAPAWRW